MEKMAAKAIAVSTATAAAIDNLSVEGGSNLRLKSGIGGVI